MSSASPKVAARALFNLSQDIGLDNSMVKYVADELNGMVETVEKRNVFRITCAHEEYFNKETSNKIMRQFLVDLSFENEEPSGLDIELDESLLGGFIAEYRGWKYDASLLFQLEQLKKSLLQ